MEPINRSARSWQSSINSHPRQSLRSLLHDSAQRSISLSSSFLGNHLAHLRCASYFPFVLITFSPLLPRICCPSSSLPSFSPVDLALPAIVRMSPYHSLPGNLKDSWGTPCAFRMFGIYPCSPGPQPYRSPSDADTHTCLLPHGHDDPARWLSLHFSSVLPPC